MIDYNNFWDEQVLSHSFHPSVRLRNKFIMDSLFILDFNDIIDIWCWDGELIKKLKNIFPEKKYTWIDISDKIIEKNKSIYNDVDFLVWDVWNSDFSLKEDLKYDVVVCSEVIEHIPDWKTVIKNLAFLTKNNWYCILTTQSGKRYGSDINIWHLKHFDLIELENEFAIYWFEIVKSYKKWWPFYNLQKWLYEKIEGSAKSIQKWNLTFFSKILFNITYYLFLISIKSKILWPQIFMVLKKK